MEPILSWKTFAVVWTSTILRNRLEVQREVVVIIGPGVRNHPVEDVNGLEQSITVDGIRVQEQKNLTCAASGVCVPIFSLIPYVCL